MQNTQKNRSLRWKIGIYTKMSLVVIVLSSVIFSGYGIYQYRVLKREKTEQLDHLAGTILARLTEDLRDPLQSSQKYQAENTLLSEMKDERVYAILVKIQEAIFTGKRRENTGQITEATETIPGNTLRKSQVVLHGDQPLGTAEVYLTTQFMKAELTHEIQKIMLLSLIIDVGLVCGLLITVRTIILVPLKQLLTLVNATSAGNFSEEIAFPANDEIGRVGQGIHHLRTRLQRVLNEVKRVSEAIARGQLDARGHADMDAAGWQAYINHTNSIIEAFMTPMTVARREKFCDVPLPKRTR